MRVLVARSPLCPSINSRDFHPSLLWDCECPWAAVAVYSDGSSTHLPFHYAIKKIYKLQQSLRFLSQKFSDVGLFRAIGWQSPKSTAYGVHQDSERAVKLT
ncbi:hypothetical protein EVAR_64436_1 [Eumeta japonica]|uniref:Uncharacterized protein n=1 Tax=Eumeta variegata TaxID=151549 RepID=A0A4C1YSN3_EUMVA|nr:hypothetical protein EVAR_64436_1 [Eumeta japonica]